MRNLALASILALALAPATVMAAGLGVPLNQSILVSLSGPAHNVFLGNPAIADVAMSDQHHVVLTGKTVGATNLIVTDDRGRTIFAREIVVGASGGNRVALVNGGAVISYACAPECEAVGQAQNSPASPETLASGTGTTTLAPGGTSVTITQQRQTPSGP